MNKPQREYEIPSNVSIEFWKLSNQTDILENTEEIEDFYFTLTNSSIEIESKNGIVKSFLLGYEQESNEDLTS